MTSVKPNATLSEINHIKSLLRKSRASIHDTLDYAAIYDLERTIGCGAVREKAKDIINHIQELIDDITF